MSAAALNDITRWKRSGFKCPACIRELWTLPVGDGKLFWCGWGKCPSIAANNGALSIELLCKNVESEPEHKEDVDWP